MTTRAQMFTIAMERREGGGKRGGEKETGKKSRVVPCKTLFVITDATPMSRRKKGRE